MGLKAKSENLKDNMERCWNDIDSTFASETRNTD